MTSPQSLRFHVNFGPKELFERIRFIIDRQGEKNLDLSHAHAAERSAERNFPIEIVKPFRPNEWDVLTAEVLPSGKFMRTTWSRLYQGKHWLVTFAKGGIVVTAYSTEPSRNLVGSGVIRGGDVFEKVARVNAELMAHDRDQN